MDMPPFIAYPSRPRLLRLCRWGLLGAAALLGACVPPGGVRMEAPDATVSFETGWKKAAACAQAQLSDSFYSSKMVLHAAENYAEITVGGNFSGATIMIIDIKQLTPGTSRAAIHAHDYMLIWGPPVSRAEQALQKCQKSS
jgi:hypothetical protein